MAELVQSTLRDGVAVIALDRPPVNALTPGLREALDDQLELAIANSDVKGVVLTGAGQGFCPGVDISEYNGPLGSPWVSDLCDKIENSPKPVVAALHGGVMGAGLELALAAHARVARSDARLAMPDVKLGMIPGAGATQRLPRILGAQRALEILLSGQVVRASDPRLTRLITQLTETSPLAAAGQLTLKLAEAGHWTKSRDEDVGFSDPDGFQAALREIKKQIPNLNSATGDILRCVESAQLLPFEQGLAFERMLFDDRLISSSARSARHFLMAEKFASTPPRSATDKDVLVRQVAMLGTRDRLGELAILMLHAGFGVTVACASAADAQAFDAWIARVLQNLAKQGRLTEAQVQERIALLECSTNFATLSKADLIVDDGSIAVVQVPELHPHCIWAVLEPESSVKSRSADLPAGKQAIGLHPYQPMSERQVVELSCSAQNSASDVAATMGVIRRLGKSAILTPLQAGTIRSVLASALYAAAIELLQHGASPYAVDASACEIGFDFGPFALMDRAGLPQVQTRLNKWARQRSLAPTYGPVLDRFVTNGRFGRSAGQGFYLYKNGTMSEDSDIARFLPPPRHGLAGQNMSTRMMGSALLGSLVNEAARLLDGHHLRRASDIDLILVKGFGYDRAMGGPLLQVDLNGVFYLYKDMLRLAEISPLWAPHKKVTTMVKQGDGFFGRSVG